MTNPSAKRALPATPILIACLLAATPLWAADAPLSEQDQLSYSVGYSVGHNLKNNGMDLDPELAAKGVAEALSGKPVTMTEKDIEATLLAYQKKRQEEAAKAKAEKDAKGQENLAKGKEYLAKNGKKDGVTTLESGLQYEVLKSGDGKSPTASDTVVTHYHGTLIDGTVFDSSVERGKPATFGVGQVIKGWTEALQKMKVGDKWRVVLPPNLAYGARGAGGKIGPNETLIFEVELLEIK